MKRTFSRIFLPAAAILLAALLVVGISFQLLARSYMKRWAMDNLENEAKALSALSAAYYAEGTLTNQGFYMNIAVCNQVSGADAVICNLRGELVLCSDSPLGCEHTALSVDSEYLRKVLENGYHETTGRIQGLYDEERYVVAMPIRDSMGFDMGIVMVSIPTTRTQEMLGKMTEMYLGVTVLVVLMAVIAAAVTARKISRPLRNMAMVASAFGHGEMDARVSVEEGSPEEVRELALAFNNMAVSLQKSDQQRREFVSNVSHELKTPMTTIGGYVDGMLDGTIPREQHPKYMQLVSDETKRLSRLVRNMLDVSRLQAKGGIREEEKRRFDACECVGRTLLSFEGKITEKNLDVQVNMPEYPVYTYAVEDAITQVMYNLLDNAVKFCPPEGVLAVELRQDDAKIYISVENDGPTMPSEELPMLFERFHKTDKSRSLDREGWGLGLAIVKTIVCGHGEDISVTSREGKTRFTFTLTQAN